MNQKLKNLITNYELIFAVLCGAFIFIAWLLELQEQATLSIVVYALAYIVGGYAKAKEGILHLIEHKDLNVDILMMIAAIGAASINYWGEGAMLIFIFSLSGALESYTFNKSHKEISALMELQPQEALRINNGTEETVPVENLQIGDIILIKPGERVPADGTIHKGETNIDEAAITGEPIPTEKAIGCGVFAGTVNLRGSIEVSITKLSSDTLFAKIIRLVQNAQSEKTPAQRFIETFEGLYVKLVLLAVVITVAVTYYFLGWNLTSALYRGMVLLIVASPCALVASITPATLSAISNGARGGILFKGGLQLEKLASLRAIAFDKTGTLTKGKPLVTDVHTTASISEQDLLEITSSLESHSTHPLADAIVNYAKNVHKIIPTPPDTIENAVGYGISGTFKNTLYKIGKPSFFDFDLNQQVTDISLKLQQEGKTLVYVGTQTEIIGILALKDTLREESAQAIDQLHNINIKTVMITGDHEETAKVIAKESNLTEYYASCLPEDKVTAIKSLQDKYGAVAMIGDGINDAPALATATVGIAMGEGTDVALETADVILMKNNLTRLPKAIGLSKRLNKVTKQNIVFSVSVISFLVIFNFVATLPIPVAVVAHEGSTILVILNGLRLLKD